MPFLSEKELFCFRTKPCVRLKRHGRCEYEERCQYSHSSSWPRRCPFYLSDGQCLRYLPTMCPDLIMEGKFLEKFKRRPGNASEGDRDEHDCAPIAFDGGGSGERENANIIERLIYKSLLCSDRKCGSVAIDDPNVEIIEIIGSRCTRGGSCPFAHTFEELLYHPLIYKNHKCDVYHALSSYPPEEGVDGHEGASCLYPSSSNTDGATSQRQYHYNCHQQHSYQCKGEKQKTCRYYCPFYHGNAEQRLPFHGQSDGSIITTTTPTAGGGGNTNGSIFPPIIFRFKSKLGTLRRTPPPSALSSPSSRQTSAVSQSGSHLIHPHHLVTPPGKHGGMGGIAGAPYEGPWIGSCSGGGATACTTATSSGVSTPTGVHSTTPPLESFPPSHPLSTGPNAPVIPLGRLFLTEEEEGLERQLSACIYNLQQTLGIYIHRQDAQGSVISTLDTPHGASGGSEGGGGGQFVYSVGLSPQLANSSNRNDRFSSHRPPLRPPSTNLRKDRTDDISSLSHPTTFPQHQQHQQHLQNGGMMDGTIYQGLKQGVLMAAKKRGKTRAGRARRGDSSSNESRQPTESGKAGDMCHRPSLPFTMAAIPSRAHFSNPTTARDGDGDGEGNLEGHSRRSSWDFLKTEDSSPQGRVALPPPLPPSFRTAGIEKRLARLVAELQVHDKDKVANRLRDASTTTPERFQDALLETLEILTSELSMSPSRKSLSLAATEVGGEGGGGEVRQEFKGSDGDDASDCVGGGVVEGITDTMNPLQTPYYLSRHRPQQHQHHHHHQLDQNHHLPSSSQNIHIADMSNFALPSYRQFRDVPTPQMISRQKYMTAEREIHPEGVPSEKQKFVASGTTTGNGDDTFLCSPPSCSPSLARYGHEFYLPIPPCDVTRDLHDFRYSHHQEQHRSSLSSTNPHSHDSDDHETMSHLPPGFADYPNCDTTAIEVATSILRDCAS